MSTEGTIDTKTENNIGTITISHPKSNALPRSLLGNLADTIEEMGNNQKVKVIKLQSRGEKAFCAGAYFEELKAIENKEEGKHFFKGFANVVNAMRTAPKFIVTRVQGKAVGGALGLIATSDYVLATHEADVRLSELQLGIGPFVVGPPVKHKVGVSAFSSLAINATEWHDAQWAYDKGLYSELTDNIDTLNKRTDQLVENLSSYSSEAMSEIKRMFWDGAGQWDSLLDIRADISGRLVLSEYTQNILSQK